MGCRRLSCAPPIGANGSAQLGGGRLPRVTYSKEDHDVGPLRTRILISVAIAAALGTHEPLRGQVRIALNDGASRDEIVELFIHLEAYAGAARAFDSYQVAAAVFAEHP